ncbi:MAG: type I restriction enzyme HsdR N-terminal domain-containing protein [Muribaculaceae bacterium]|nr:N-6 DNA methylase [Barnesiella sp.]MDE6283591.1 type I restriction enzyme HsdR N-terminal domain-containing protein [Muribaculaceae bacterium]
MAETILITPDGKVRDYIDGTIRKETPEEYVRQTVEKRLVIEHKYAKSQIAVEFPVKMGDGKKRADIVIFPNGASKSDCKDQHKIRIIIECKKEAVNPSDSQEGIEQLKSYMAACSNCEYGMWTNGKHKTVFRKVSTPLGIEFEEANDIPSADGTNNANERPKRTNLTRASDDNLLFTFRTCHDIISVNEGHSKQAAFFEFLKIIFCKIHDERELFKPIEFFTTSTERHYPDGQASVYNRISTLFNEVKKKNSSIFDPNDEIKLEPRTVTQIVGELQKYSLLNTDIDFKGKAYEEIVGSNLRGDRGEFFTPRNVMRMAVAMLNPKEGETCLDSSCGTGGFIVSAMTYVMATLTEQLCVEYGAKEGWPAEVRSQFDKKISQVAADNFFGFDINPDLVKATKMNMVMNNDGSGNIIQLNTLEKPILWPEDRKETLKRAMKKPHEIVGIKTIGIFDCIVTNPPFGSKIPITDHGILEQFDLAHTWNVIPGQGWVMSKDKLRSSVPPEQIFIERIVQLLRPGGRAAVVLPDSIFSSPGLEFIRIWLMRKTRIVASIDLHADTFQPHNGTQCSVLIVEKKTEEEINIEERTGQILDYEIFMAMIDHIGHDKRGNTIYVRDADGNLVMEHKTQEVRETDADGNVTVRQETFDEKIINDQTLFVPEIFARWKKEQGIVW